MSKYTGHKIKLIPEPGLARNNWKGLLYNIMINRRDCILLLTELSESGLNVDSMLQRAMKTSGVDMEVLKFINQNRQLDVNAFYEKIRKSYNSKKSTLYKNIVTCDEVEQTPKVVTTLAALNLQILLFSEKVSDVNMFMRHTRFDEINQALLNYGRTYDLVPCIQVLQVVKADLKAFEYMNKF